MIPLKDSIKTVLTETGMVDLRYLIEDVRCCRYSKLSNAEAMERRQKYQDAALELGMDIATQNQDEKDRILSLAFDKAEKMQESDETGIYEKRKSEYIDIFVSGWNDSSLPDYPENKNPSSVLLYYQRAKIFKIIIDNILELTGLSKIDIKN